MRAIDLLVWLSENIRDYGDFNINFVDYEHLDDISFDLNIGQEFTSEEEYDFETEEKEEVTLHQVKKVFKYQDESCMECLKAGHFIDKHGAVHCSSKNEHVQYDSWCDEFSKSHLKRIEFNGIVIRN